MIETLKELAIIVGIPVVRSVLGWITKALEDGIITYFEWKLLCSTVIRVGSIGLAGFYGLGAMGLDVPALSVALGAFVTDKFFSALKNYKEKK